MMLCRTDSTLLMGLTTIEDVRTKSTCVTFAKFDPHFTKSLKASKCKRVNSKYFHVFLLNTFAHSIM